MNSSNEQQHPRKARIFSNIITFTDYLCAFNKDKFENNYNDIYPDELKFKMENRNPYKSL